MEKRQRTAEVQSQASEDGTENLRENSTVGGVSSIVEDAPKPYVGMEFEREEFAKDMYNAYAKKLGFSTRVGKYDRAKPDGPIVSWEFGCSREVFKRKNVETCNAMLRIDKKDPDGWVVTRFVEDHNHSVVSPSTVHYLRPRRHFVGATKTTPETTQTQNDGVSVDGNHVFHDPNTAPRNSSPVETNLAPRNPSLVETNHALPEVNNVARDPTHIETNRPAMPTVPLMPMHFVQPPTRRRILGREAQNLLTYFQKMQAENPGFFYAIQLDDDNRLCNIFWADARSRTAYSHFGDAVTFDTMYRPNQFLVPFAPFTGVNNHGQLVLFGCALILDESEASFVWLFSTWLSAMNNRPPVSITTDQDRAIKAAVHRVLPKTRHCICKWHILREGQERLAHIYLAHPTFYGELYSCINFSETTEDFESSWSSILEKYDLSRNDWLQAVYKAREQWAPVYFRDTFFAALLSNHGVSSFFDGYVNQQTTLPMFFKQYERALENSLEREIESDHDTECTTPVLKTASPMEQQAANSYTKKVFMKFQEELVETFVYTANKIGGDGTVSKFRVAKYESDHKAFIVTLDFSEMNAGCSCLMFEYLGVLCRHILTVFTVTNILTVPSHYILKRWTRNARAILLDRKETDVRCVESLTVRFNKLCWEAQKFAEDGSIATETYNAAIDILREGARKIAMTKKNIEKIKPPMSQGSGSFQENGGKDVSTSASSMIPSLWPWQDALPNRFNLNDAGAPVTDLSQPTISTLAMNRDGSLADNTVVLTCFKSMSWIFENVNTASRVAVINLKLQDFGKGPSGETVVQFRLTKVTLEPMLKSLVYISQQLSRSANRVAVINLKLKTTTGETEVKFQVSRETLGSMLASLAHIREQL